MAQTTVIAFDVYGTLLSPGSIARDLEQYVNYDKERAQSIATLWRRYQLEYTWRLNSMGLYISFEEVTHNALIHALLDTGTSIQDDDIKELLQMHDNMAAFPDVEPALDQLARAQNVMPIIFTNGTSNMVSKSILQSGPLSHHRETFRDLVSVDDIRKFKPAPEAYRYLAQRVGKCVPEMKDIWVISSNPFDIIGALHVGMRVIWIDRSGKGWADRAAPGLEPTAIVNSLEEILHVIHDHTG
ncbi:HAD-like domain-containing protein [Aspergillus minisclerotigenes]|uniref:HAD-like domain-containing protein n=1 Tax=Aspergillus minisclerotigenes TaxID=656917 RepID=A0A5N6IY01_9EURO|nr:HAD-like domain-containing protein [Aspergillus minisclerotigenes]